MNLKKVTRGFCYTLLVGFSLTLTACFKGKSVDLIIHNAQIHTMNEKGEVHEAIAIKDGKIVELGPERQILNKYTADGEIDAGGKDVYPGLTDAHGHMLMYARQRLNADLVGSKSFDEVLVRLEKYQSKTNRTFIVGAGWDQSLWVNTEFPTNEQLNKLFPTIPVCLMRIDGHALLANDALLKKAGIDEQTIIEGGEVFVKDGKCTGMITDNAMLGVFKLIPAYSERELIGSLLDVQHELLQYGITGVHEAGVEFEEIGLFKKLIDHHEFKLNIYAMLTPSEKNIAFARKNGIYTYKNLSIRSFKVMGDGSLGSRGAFLKKPYSDSHKHFGALLTPIKDMKRIATICELTGYQMNTHSIGDSTSNIMLNIYKGIFEVNKDHRWRIEHAQVLDPKDFMMFSDYGVFASVQPTHAVSDQRWAEARIGKERMKGAYAYKTLLKHCGMLALGTDFPIELTDPFRTIHAAVQRKNADNFPAGGFYPNEALTFEECLKGMTIWAAYASFDEARLGSLEKGKEATFVIFVNPVNSAPEYRANFAAYTFIKGQKVYSVD